MRLSVQLYTVRDAAQADFVGTLTKLRAMGVDYIEGGGYVAGATPAEGRKILDDAGLKVSGTHFGLPELEENPDKIAEAMGILGVPYVIIPSINRDVYQDGWDKVAKRLEPVGRKLNSHGLKLCYHNHDSELKLPGPPLDILFDNADPLLVNAQIDVAWVQIGSGDPAAYIRKLKGRVPVLHLKDFDLDKSPIWRPCGQGKVDWDDVLAAAAGSEVDFGAIELDESPGDPFDAVRESVEFFNSKGIL